MSAAAPSELTTVETLEFPRPEGPAWLAVDAACAECDVLLNGERIFRHLGAWTPFSVELPESLCDVNRVELRCRVPATYSTLGFLPAIGVRWCGADGARIVDTPPASLDPVPSRASIDGQRFLIDGEPVTLRGILHWGFYPELGHPWPSEWRMREEITELKARGFNLIKFCLWIPPRRYFELCDELGMWVWQEYPLWDRPLRDPELALEYEQWILHDAPFGCVVLRSLTCENDRVDSELARAIIARGKEIVPGALFIDNSSWRSAEHEAAVLDEHQYHHNAQWRYLGTRQRSLPEWPEKPFVLGETMAVDSIDARSHRTALDIRRHQITTLEHHCPGAGYMITALRDLPDVPLGICRVDGHHKHSAEEWAWHGRSAAIHRPIPPLRDRSAAPHAAPGGWKCHENTLWSPIVRVHDSELPAEKILDKAFFELLSGRVLHAHPTARVLVELWDVHPGTPHRHPLVVEYAIKGERHYASAFRTDTPFGAELDQILAARTNDAPDLGEVTRDATILDRWTMIREGEDDIEVWADTPLVNQGANVFEGWATFRSEFEIAGGAWMLCCESVGDFFEVQVDGELVGEAGNRTGTWDGTRDVERRFELTLAAGTHSIVFLVRDWRAAGGMVGPVYVTRDPESPLY